MSSNIRDVAKLADVSPSTVSRVINNSAPVSEVVRKKVMDAVKQLNYGTNPSQMNNNGDYKVGIVLPRRLMTNYSEHPTLYDAFTSFTDSAGKLGITTIPIVIEKIDFSSFGNLFSPLLDGYFILGIDQDSENIISDNLKHLKIPFVVANRWFSDHQISTVNIDDYEASFSAVSFLIDLGYKRIAFVGGEKSYRNSILRFNGFMDATDKAHINVPSDYIVFGEYSDINGYNAARTLLSLKDPPDAAFFCSDNMVIGAQKYCFEKGISLPQQFGMFGYGDIALSKYVYPHISTIAIPSSEIGIQASKLLFYLINNPSVMAVNITLKANMVIRESCIKQ